MSRSIMIGFAVLASATSTKNTTASVRIVIAFTIIVLLLREALYQMAYVLSIVSIKKRDVGHTSVVNKCCANAPQKSA